MVLKDFKIVDEAIQAEDAERWIGSIKGLLMGCKLIKEASKDINVR